MPSIPTRGIAVLNFPNPVTLYYTREEIIHNAGSRLGDQPRNHNWIVETHRVSAVDCRRIPAETTRRWLYQLDFFSLDGENVVARVDLYVPPLWLPRTVLVLLANKLRRNLDVITVVVLSNGETDVAGILREAAGVYYMDIHHRNYLSASDRMVSGGGSFQPGYHHYHDDWTLDSE